MLNDYCEFCGQKIKGNKHRNICPYNDVVLKEIIEFLIGYLIKNSKFNKNFRPFPTIKEFQRFLKSKKLMGLKTIRRHYFEEGMKLEDFLSELLELGVYKKVIQDEDFPAYLRFVYDSWLFYNREQYVKMYKEAVAYEDEEFEGGSNQLGQQVIKQGYPVLFISTDKIERTFKT